MSWYEFLLFAHIACAVIWVGGAAAIQFFALRVLRANDPVRVVDFSADVEWVGIRVFVPASLLAFASGLWLVIEAEFWGFGDDWILIGLGLFAVTFLAGVLFFSPESGRLSKLAADEGPTAPNVLMRIQRILALSRADLILLFLIIYDMAVKPEFGDGSFWIAVLVAAALAGLLVRHGLSTRIRAATA